MRVYSGNGELVSHFVGDSLKYQNLSEAMFLAFQQLGKQMTADVHRHNGITSKYIVKFHSSIQLIFRRKSRQLSTVVLILASDLSSDPTQVASGSFTRSCSASGPKSMTPLTTLLPN